jgi:hypothetical protein
MGISLTDDQQKNIAASLRSAADVIDPPVMCHRPSTGTDISGILGQSVFEDYFETDAGEGEFLSKYGQKWTAYPYGWRDTSKKGIYNPGIISVTGGIMTMRLRTSSQGNRGWLPRAQDERDGRPQPAVWPV